MLLGEAASSFSLPPLAARYVTAAHSCRGAVRTPRTQARHRSCRTKLTAAANAQIGVAEAAFFPTLTLSASGGFESTSHPMADLADALLVGGAGISETVYDGDCAAQTDFARGL